MPKKPRNVAKRRPKQDRSRSTVEALLEGTARVLVREGYDRASTNRIAEAAGVNIGSLYQYFPSKDALVAELIDRHLEAVQTVVGAALMEVSDAPLSEVLRVFLRAYLKIHAGDPDLQRVLLQQVPRVERINPIVTLRRNIIEATKEFLESRAADFKVSNPDQTAFILVHTLDALTQAAILERPNYLQDESYLDGVLTLVSGLLALAPA